MSSALRFLRALALAALTALVFHTHVFVEFRPVRAKVVQAPVAAIDGTVRVTTAGFPQLQGLRPPFALIARIKASAAGSQRVTISFDGSPVCERDVEGGASRRVDCAVTAGDAAAADREVVVSSPATPWTLEYLELATHHGNTTGAHTLFVLPGASSTDIRPGLGWSVALWAVLAGLLLLPPSLPTIRGLRVAFRAIAGAIIALLAVVQCSERVSDYRVVLAAGSFAVWLAVLLAPRLWTAGCWLAWRAGRASDPLEAAVAKTNALFGAHPAWRSGGASRRKALSLSAFALVVGLFCVPLFVNLGEPEARSDESLYFYAVERMLDTGDWLTPRLIPNDWPFLEKPPLKFWIVAAGVRSGLLTRDEAGMRWFDALFGAAGFVYVYLLGRRLSGPINGIVAVLVLFTLDPLIFEHGLRSNNMEAPLFLSYCGGVFHFATWVERADRRARGHAIAFAAWFVLGFMTKFVAVLFLPVVCAVALAWHPAGWSRVRSGWRDWIVAGALAVGVVAPWFIYQTAREGAGFWRVIVGAQVYQRFTAVLDPGHLQPWDYYFTRTWTELRSSGTQWLALAGAVRLAVAAARGQSWLSRLVLVWGVLPTVAISFGTSKLVHYLYPFWPMIGLAAGLVAADLARAVGGAWGDRTTAWLRRRVPPAVAAWALEDAPRRTMLLVVASAAGAMAIVIAAAGPFDVAAGGATFRTPPVVWPLAASVLAFFSAGSMKALVRVAAAVGLLALAAVPAYGTKIARVREVDHPIRAVRDCMIAVQRAGSPAGSGVLGIDNELEHWGYFYYLRSLGRWNVKPDFSLEEAHRHLWTSGEQTPVFVSHANYDALVRRAGLWEDTYPSRLGPFPTAADRVADAARNPLRSGVRFNEHLAVLLPGPFQACLPDVIAAAGQTLWATPAGRRHP